MVGQPIEYSRSKDKAPAVVFTGGSALNLIIDISVHGISVSIVGSLQAKELSPLTHMISYGVYFGALCHLNIQSQKTKPPRLFSRGGSALNLIIQVCRSVIH